MKILHTADWHLGVSLGAEKRFEEFDRLLSHFCSLIREEGIEAVIIAGDVFDSHMPSNRAAEQYYRFLVAALSNLRNRGKLVGVISHVTAFSERIPCIIEVNKSGGGRSTLSGPGIKAI